MNEKIIICAVAKLYNTDNSDLAENFGKKRTKILWILFDRSNCSWTKVINDFLTAFF
jgi:hypothetical protein